ncbi:MAG: hypothetical protein EZS28_027926 [Streblomastix strix]|uniref:Uncharacterized protein n=1 Tax=Streblomastix strix TaxID=222440 RepID=A0A5J4V1F8_9EUKA|nr:MAG: hypothetical protein EZS28_027926 [Streblomastix strix]
MQIFFYPYSEIPEPVQTTANTDTPVAQPEVETNIADQSGKKDEDQNKVGRKKGKKGNEEEIKTITADKPDKNITASTSQVQQPVKETKETKADKLARAEREREKEKEEREKKEKEEREKEEMMKNTPPSIVLLIDEKQYEQNNSGGQLQDKRESRPSEHIVTNTIIRPMIKGRVVFDCLKIMQPVKHGDYIAYIEDVTSFQPEAEWMRLAPLEIKFRLVFPGTLETVHSQWEQLEREKIKRTHDRIRDEDDEERRKQHEQEEVLDEGVGDKKKIPAKKK